MAETPIEIGRVQRILTMRGFAGWSALSNEEFAILAELAKPRFVPAGTTVISGDEPINALFLVVDGTLQTRRDGRVSGTFGPGGAVGGLAAFAGVTEGYEVLAETDSTLLEMQVADLEELFEERFRVLWFILRELARQNLTARRELVPGGGYPAEAHGGEACPARPLDLIERIFYLRRNLAIDPAAIDSIAVLAKAAVEVRRAPGELLWSFGDPADSMVAILCGRVRCTSPLGHRFELGAGDLAGSLDTNAELPRWYRCEVIDGLVGLVLGHDVLLDVWEDHSGLALRLLRTFSRQALDLMERQGK